MLKTGLLPEIEATGHTGAVVSEWLNPGRLDGLWGLECPFCVALKSICDTEYSYNEYLDKFKCGPHRKKTPATPEGARIMPPNECLCHQCTKCPTLWLHLECMSSWSHSSISTLGQWCSVHLTLRARSRKARVSLPARVVAVS